MNTTTDWQTWTAIGVIVVTALAFAIKSAKKKSGSGCGSCGCGQAHDKKTMADKTAHRH